MMRRVLTAVFIVIVANVAMLVGVAVNRSGEPAVGVRLTERELPLAFASGRDSARQLQIRIDRSGTIYPSWLRRHKLAALGFDVDATPQDATAIQISQLPRRVFVVLEYDGPAWVNYLSELRRRHSVMVQQMDEVRRGVRAQNAVTETSVPGVDDEERAGSRLMAIDAGTDDAALRQAYPDRRMHIIVPATIRAQLDFRSAADRLTGSISLVTASLVVPRQWRGVLDALGAPVSEYQGAWRPRYAVTVAYGARHEPWVTSIETIDTSVAPH